MNCIFLIISCTMAACSMLLFVNGDGHPSSSLPPPRFLGRPSPQREGKSFAPTNNNNIISNSTTITKKKFDENGTTHKNSLQTTIKKKSFEPSARTPRQLNNELNGVNLGEVAAAGEQCIDKVVTVQETEYDDYIECKHSYSKKCFVTYTTDYSPQQEEECTENFKKNCFIEFKKVAVEEDTKFCFTPLVKNCDIPGPIECTNEYQSQCVTSYHEHDVQDDVADCIVENEEKCTDVTQGYTTEQKCTKWPVKKCSLRSENVKKYSPETKCSKVPIELCGPAGCVPEPGPEECQDKRKTVIQEAPEEVCNLEPQRECKLVTKLVPLLKAAENCVDLPKEVCVRSRRNPRKVNKPVLKKWCYTPTEESGLIPGRGSGRPGNQNQGAGRPNGRDRSKPSETTIPCSGCRQKSRNGQCDQECNTRQCGYDGGECEPKGCNPNYKAGYCEDRRANGICDPECNTQNCFQDGGDCVVSRTTEKPGCAQGYPADYCPSKRNNGVCEPECNTRLCGYDGSDCQIETPTPKRRTTPKAPTESYLPPSNDRYG